MADEIADVVDDGSAEPTEDDLTAGSDDLGQDDPEPVEDEAEDEPEERPEPRKAPAPKPAAKPAPKTEEKPPPPKTYKIKAHGKEEDVDAAAVETVAKALGVAPEKFLRDGQMLRAGQEALRQAAEMRRQADSIRESKSVAELMERIGIPVEAQKEFAEQLLMRQIQEEQLTPEQRENLELKRRLDAVERERQTQAQQQEQARLEAATQEERVSLDRSFRAALDAGAVPPTRVSVARLAGYMADRLTQIQDVEFAHALDDMGPADFAPLVAEDMAKEAKFHFAEMPPDRLAETLGPEVVEKIRQYLVAKVRRRPATPAQDQQPAPRPRTAPQAPRSVNQALRAFIGG